VRTPACCACAARRPSESTGGGPRVRVSCRRARSPQAIIIGAHRGRGEPEGGLGRPRPGASRAPIPEAAAAACRRSCARRRPVIRGANQSRGSPGPDGGGGGAGAAPGFASSHPGQGSCRRAVPVRPRLSRGGRAEGKGEHADGAPRRRRNGLSHQRAPRVVGW